MKNTLISLLSALFVMIIGGCSATARLGVFHETGPAAPYEVLTSSSNSQAVNKPGLAKTLSWRPDAQTFNNSVMKVGDNDDLKPQAVDVKVQIDGFRARVVVDSFYHNPYNANLEGAFKYRLPNGARPYFFAFGETFSQMVKFDKEHSQRVSDNRHSKFDDLNPKKLLLARKGKWKEPKQAIMVSRAKAALAYTTIVARQVDPALVEWSGSGVFSAKVFPLQANKLHRVVIGYDVDLLRVGNDLVFDLPLNGLTAEKRIHVNVATAEQTSVRFHQVIDDQVQQARYHNRSDEVGATQHQQTFVGNNLGGIKVVVPDASSSVLTGEDSAGRYFAMRSLISLPEIQLTANDRAVFALDTSWSAAPEKFQLWVDLLLATLENNQHNIKKFAVMTFSIDHHWWQPMFIDNNKGNRQALAAYLNRTVLEGATDLNEALLNAGKPSWLPTTGSVKNDYDLFLYSDGAVTWGESEAYLLSENLKEMFAGRLLAYGFGLQGENTELVNHLTREFSGAVYQLAASNDIPMLSKAHNSMPWKIESIKLAGADDVIIEGRPNILYSGQQLKIAGRINSTLDGPLNIKMSLAGREKILRLPISKTVESDLTARVYGQISVNQLESLGDIETLIASAYANHFRVPGASSSLLMLESERDYRAHNIKPKEDAFVVASKTVTGTFEKLTADFKVTLTDQKKRFINQIERLEQIQNINFSLPSAVSILLEDMPESVFEVEFPELKTSLLQKQNVSEKYLETAGNNSDIYDVIEAEAQARFKNSSGADALKVMSSLVEIAPADTVVLREVAFAAEQWELYGAAFKLHQKVAKVRPYEPQTYTDLAKLADRLGRADLALLYYEVGLASHWTNRFGQFHLVHKMEYLNFLRKVEKNSVDFYSKSYAKLKTQSLLREINFLKSELIVAVSWNTDRTDVDLHVIEPNGERCSYKNRRPRSRCQITRDVTTGYGPEMYIHRNGGSGEYKIYADYFASDQNSLGLKTKVRVKIIKDWGSDSQLEKTIVVTLKSNEIMHEVATIKL